MIVDFCGKVKNESLEIVFCVFINKSILSNSAKSLIGFYKSQFLNMFYSFYRNIIFNKLQSSQTIETFQKNVQINQPLGLKTLYTLFVINK